MHNAFAISDIGRKRKVNEDSYVIRDDINLWMIADGMGGHDNGKYASEITCKIVCDYVEQGKSVESAVLAAHAYIQKMSQQLAVANGMGCTVVILHKAQDSYCVSWVGDSRAYLVEQHALKQLTRDHSIVQELLDAKLISEHAAKTHLKRNMVTQSIGLSRGSLPHVDSVVLELSDNAEIFLCSDGVNSELDDANIAAVLAKKCSKTDRLKHLVEQANLNGGRDNITAMLVSQ